LILAKVLYNEEIKDECMLDILLYFYRWRANKRYLDYLRKQEVISSTMLQNVPVFGAALLQVLRYL
jgi:hypothetical protein